MFKKEKKKKKLSNSVSKFLTDINVSDSGMKSQNSQNHKYS